MTLAGETTTRPSESETLITVRNLAKHYPVREGLLRTVAGHVHAVDGVSFELRAGETVGLVGESGCGKSTLGRCVAGLIQPSGGGVYYGLTTDELGVLDVSDADDSASTGQLERIDSHRRVDKMAKSAWKDYRLNCQMVFQDSLASLNPRHLVYDIIGRPLRVHRGLKGAALTRRVLELMAEVGLDRGLLYRYPHQFSGGQRQRVSIARALALDPKVVVLDEPTSALDVSVQAQILNLLSRLQKRHGLSYLFISHDLNVVRHISDRVLVMYLGGVCEYGPVEAVFDSPQHPYTQALLAAGNITTGRSLRLDGDVPDPADPPTGCRFHTRCPLVTTRCGWELRDLLDWLRRTHPRIFGRITESFAETAFSGTIDFADAESARECLELLESSRDETSLLTAISSLAVDDTVLTVELPRIERISLDTTKPSEVHAAACVLVGNNDHGLPGERG